MKTLIELERLPNAPKFIDERGGEYSNPIIKLYYYPHKLGSELTLHFGLFSDPTKKEPSLSFVLNFNHTFITPVPNENGGFLHLGKPSYNKLLTKYLEFGADGKLYLINIEGKNWFTNTPMCYFPNSLGESNLSNWKFIS